MACSSIGIVLRSTLLAMTGTAVVFWGLAIAPLVDSCVDASLPVQPPRISTDRSEMSASSLATLLIHPNILRSALIMPHLRSEGGWVRLTLSAASELYTSITRGGRDEGSVLFVSDGAGRFFVTPKRGDGDVHACAHL